MPQGRNDVRRACRPACLEVCHEINGLTDYLKEEQEHYRAETMNMIFHYQEIAEIQKKKAKKVNIPHL